MAEAFFNQMAKGRAKAISAGSKPDSQVNPVAVEVMREEGIDISHNKPKLLTLEMMRGIDMAVTMGCEDTCPFATAPTRDWALEDPKNKPIEKVRMIRNDIKNRVKSLLDEILEADPKGPTK
jgi:protein-tyrosine-phosphatase